MGIEIERKFLVTSDAWESQVYFNYQIKQGYLSTHPDRTVRVRSLGPDLQESYLAIKGRSIGIARTEVEVEIGTNEALQLFLLCDPSTSIISKRRHCVWAFPGRLDVKWEIDVFEGDNTGLIIAEIELPNEDFHLGVLPNWIGHDVSEDCKYSNSELAIRPFCEWRAEEK